jgi:hypothetical protein
MIIQKIAVIGAMEFLILSFIIPLWNSDWIVKYKRTLESLSLILGFGFLTLYFYLKDNSELTALCVCLFLGMIILGLYIQIFKQEKIEILILPEGSYRIYTEDSGNTSDIHVQHRIAFGDHDYIIAAPSIAETPTLKLYLHKDKKGRVTNVDAAPMKKGVLSIKENVFYICAVFTPVVYLLVDNIQLVLYYIFILVFAYAEIMFRGANDLLIKILHIFSIIMMISLICIFVSLVL